LGFKKDANFCAQNRQKSQKIANKRQKAQKIDQKRQKSQKN
jgi:hypothetical protein